LHSRSQDRAIGRANSSKRYYIHSVVARPSGCDVRRRGASRGGRTSLQWLRVWGAASRCLRDAGVRRTAWTGEDAPTRVGEHPREALRDVGPTVIAACHDYAGYHRTGDYVLGTHT